MDAPEKTARKTVQPGLRGGTLKVGNPGNKGGTGRPPDEIRRLCRDGGYKILSKLLDDYDAGLLVFTDHQLSLLDKCFKFGLPKQEELSGPDGGPMQAQVAVKWIEPPKPEEDE